MKNKKGYVKYEKQATAMELQPEDQTKLVRDMYANIHRLTTERNVAQTSADTWEKVASQYLGRIRDHELVAERNAGKMRELEHQVKVANDANRALNQELMEVRRKALKWDTFNNPTRTSVDAHWLNTKLAELDNLKKDLVLRTKERDALMARMQQIRINTEM